MNLPAQAAEAADLAEKLHQQMFEQENTTVEDDQNTDPATTYEPQEDGGEHDEQIPHDDDVEELRKFKSRYLSLKGKYDAEVPRLSQELRDLKTSVFQRLDQQTTPKTTTPEEEAPDFLESFKENYGEDFAENLKQLIALEAKKLTQPVQAQVASVEDAQIKVAKNNFVSYIDTQLNEGRDKPLDWQSLWSGKDPKFIEFLNQPDPSGLYTYAELAELYNENWDADKLVNIFKLYDGMQTPTKAAQSKPTVVSPQKQAMVAPSRANTHVAPNTETKQIWNKDMIDEFQRNDRQGKYSPEESKAMWDDLLSALGENRIR